MDKTKQPGISFDGIILVKENYWRDFNIPNDTVIDLKFEAKNNMMDKSATVEINSKLTLSYEDKVVLSLESTFVAFFSTVEGDENMSMVDYIDNNSVALMFPYIREHVSSITGKSGIKPVMLPPINLMAILNKK